MRCPFLWLAIFLFSPMTFAKTLWKADFETGDLSQWQWIDNPEVINISTECAFDGRYSGKIALSGEAQFLWSMRTDFHGFHYSTEKASLHEGKETFYAFSFYLPQVFSSVGQYELGYWESDKNWQSITRFTIDGEDFSFKATDQDNDFWKEKNGAKAGQWHKVAMHILWSIDPKKGFVQIWLDGKDKGQFFFKTLATKNTEIFNQLDILRNQPDTIEVMYIDKVFVTDNLTELLETDAALLGKPCR